MSTMKGREDSVKARPERTRVTHPEQGRPHPEPFADKVRDILAALGENPGREGLLKTPERVEASLRFLTQGYRMTVADAVGDAVFEESHQSMIMVRDIEL
ncbi:MAG TPA: GTP cyclohydrolase I, partial [Anaerolineales bacterium]